jgi:MFS family permease
MFPADHPFRIANFRAYWLSRFTSTIALSAMAIIIGWQVYGIARDVHHLSIRESTFLLGMIGVAQFVPLFLLTPIVGLVADTFDRRLIVKCATALVAATTAMLGILTALGWLNLYALFGAAALIGVVRAFSGPAYSALAPNLVPRAVLPTAIAVSSIAWQVGAIAGPSLGGLLYAIHPDVAYGTSTVLLLVALIMIFMIGKVPQPREQSDDGPLHRIAEGFRYVRNNRLVLATITLDLFAVLLAGATALLPVFARDILHVGPEGLGQMRAAPALGAAVVALWMSWKPLEKNVGAKMLWAVAAYGVATLAFGVSRWFPLSLIFLALLGAADMVSVFVRSSLVQLNTPDDVRGRVQAISGLAISASNELGEMQSGLAAALLGAMGAVVFGGVGAIVITVLWARLFPELIRARTFAPQYRQRETAQ